LTRARKARISATTLPEGTKAAGFLKQTQSSLLHQMLGVGACFGSELRELRFLLGCELDFHALKIREYRPLGNGVMMRSPQGHNRAAAFRVMLRCCATAKRMGQGFGIPLHFKFLWAYYDYAEFVRIVNTFRDGFKLTSSPISNSISCFGLWAIHCCREGKHKPPGVCRVPVSDFSQNLTFLQQAVMKAGFRKLRVRQSKTKESRKVF
jgi:hypothetical protein